MLQSVIVGGAGVFMGGASIADVTMGGASIADVTMGGAKMYDRFFSRAFWY